MNRRFDRVLLARHVALSAGAVAAYVFRSEDRGNSWTRLGGNKTRHNEFLLGDALDQQADMLVWGAGVQSNNCRQTAAAAALATLDVYRDKLAAMIESDALGMVDEVPNVVLAGTKAEFVDILSARTDNSPPGQRRVLNSNQARNL